MTVVLKSVLLAIIMSLFTFSCHKNDDITNTISSQTSTNVKGLTNNEAIINDNGVRLRSIPILESQILYLFQKSQKVVILGRTSSEKIIDNQKDYWYKVLFQERLEGWVYGLYLDKGNTENIKIYIIHERETYEKAAVSGSIVSDDHTNLILLYTGNYNFFNSTFQQSDPDLQFFFIAIDAEELENGIYKGLYEAGFYFGPGDTIASKVNEPVYIQGKENTLQLDTLASIYDGILLTDEYQLIHYSGSCYGYYSDE